MGRENCPSMYESAMVSRAELPSREQREQALEAAGYNVFGLSASDVYVDLLTDSGTGTMSTDQWAAMMRGDESYAGSESFEELTDAIESMLGVEHVVPAHQGRGAEHLLYGALVEEGNVVISNTHFDTTRAHVAEAGGEPVDCPVDGVWSLESTGDFDGNLDIERARERVASVGAEQVPVIIMTVTNNSATGQPVSVENIRRARELADDIGARLVLDACRVAENAWFVKRREPEYQETAIEEIVRQQVSHADAVVVSGKKDGLVNMGGFVGLADHETELFEELKQRAILYEGFYTYGGMSGRTMAAMAVGLREAVDPGYLDARIGQVQELATGLDEVGVPVYQPTGGHAVYVDAGKALPHVPEGQYPGQALVCEAYREGGVRAVELGSFAFAGTDRPELVRLAVPRRRYHREHLQHVVETFGTIVEHAEEVPGYEILEEPKRAELRHFSATLAPVE
jgi:tryptophanase